MIKTKEELKYFLLEDLKRYGGNKPSLFDYILHKEWVIWWNYQKIVRYFEYYENNRDRSLWHKAMWFWYYYRHRKRSLELHSFIHPNTVGPGLCIYHTGQVMLSRTSTIGRNFTCRPGCVIGNIDGNQKAATIGDEVTLSLGVKVLGPVTIGRGSLINANSVVTTNVPPYAVVTGNPAKIMGFRMTPKEIVNYEKLHYDEEYRLSLDLLESNYQKYFLNRRKEIINLIKL